ncbi:MAG: AEC family transporter [Propionicimonas sp.]|uniref:AEC family transporter n=1 Tax=Propionicimonas sp. TaxID=1955623 RepID=UPI003D0C9CA3
MAFGVPAGQVLIMFILIALGWAAFRLHWIGQESLKGMTNLLLYLVSPSVTILAFQRPFDADRLRMMGIVFLVDLAAFALTIGIANALFNRRVVPDADTRTALRFGTVYSNAGFIGIPLAQAILGNDGVFYTVAFIAAFTVMVWTHGASLFGHDDEALAAKVRRVAVNPGIVSIVIALPLFLFSVTLPSPISDVLGYLASMNTPLSMVVVGVNLAAFSLRTVFSDRLVWLGTVARNVLVPAVFIALLGLLPIDPVARLAIVISVSAPVGAFLVIFSVRHDRDTQFATRLLCLSTLASVVTLPAALAAATALWGSA